MLYYKIRVVGIHQLSKEDISQIKKDWELIKTKVLEGKTAYFWRRHRVLRGKIQQVVKIRNY